MPMLVDPDSATIICAAIVVFLTVCYVTYRDYFSKTPSSPSSPASAAAPLTASRDAARAVTVAPRPKTEKIASKDKVKRRDSQKGKKSSRYIRRFGGHSGHVLCMAVSPDGAWIATSGEDAQVRVARTEKSSSMFLRFNVEGDVATAISWAADNRTLAVSLRDSGNIIFLRMRQKKGETEKKNFKYELAELVKRRFSTSAAKPSGSLCSCILDKAFSFCLLVTCDMAGTARVWDGKSGDLLSGKVSTSGGSTLSCDGHFLASRGDGTSSELRIY